MRQAKIVGSLFIAWLALAACTPDKGGQSADADSQEATGSSEIDPVLGGRLAEARSNGQQMPAEEAAGGLPKTWQEIVDQGDDPLTPGCACQHELPNCGGPIVGRAVDECFPKDGVSLNEKTLPTDCGTYGDKDYDCEKLLGKGARCKLVQMDCCGVATTSAYCYLDITLKK